MNPNLLLLFVCASSLLIELNANAQIPRTSDIVAGMSDTRTGSTTNRSIPIGISFRTLRNFSKMFAQTEARWYEVDDAYIAKFSSSSSETMVVYGKRGSWLYTIRRYGEKCLSGDVREHVKSTYFDYTITHIDEIHLPNHQSIIYIIQAQKEQNFIKLRVCDREMEIIPD